MIITLTGPSACGKSTALKHFLAHKQPLWKPVQIGKFVTRERRVNDGDEVVNVAAIPAECDLVYEQYGTRYGLTSQRLRDELHAGRDCLVIINDVRVVGDLKAMFGGLVRSIFFFKESPKLEAHLATAASRGIENRDDALRRFQKAQAIFRIYIENITLFDHVVLNVGDHALLKRQVHCVVDSISRTKRGNRQTLAKA